MKGRAERPVQRSILTMLDVFGCMGVHVPNGAHLAGGSLSRAKQMAALKADGLKVGFPDLLVFDLKHPPRIGFIEVKREKGAITSENQHQWAYTLREWGFDYASLTNEDQVQATLKLWGWR